MKSGIVFGVSFILFTSMVYAGMHAFELKDGRALEAEVIGFNARLGKVELKRPDGKRVKVKPDIFTDADQKYIREWAMLDGFQNPSTFKVECAEKKIEQWKEESSAFQTKYERFVYEITFENKAAVPVGTLKVEYRIFFEQEENDLSTKKVATSKLTKPGSFDVGLLDVRDKKMMTSESIVLKEFEFNMSDYYVPGGDPESTNGEISGIWLKITVTSEGGQVATRDVFEPSSIAGKFTW